VNHQTAPEAIRAVDQHLRILRFGGEGHGVCGVGRMGVRRAEAKHLLFDLRPSQTEERYKGALI